VRTYWVSPAAQNALSRVIERGGPTPVLHRSETKATHTGSLEGLRPELYLSIPGEQVAHEDWTQLLWLNL